MYYTNFLRPIFSTDAIERQLTEAPLPVGKPAAQQTHPDLRARETRRMMHRMQQIHGLERRLFN